MDEDLNKIAPLLSKINKDSLFKVPDGYFDNFTDRIIDKVKTEKRNNTINLFIKNSLKIAASLIFILALYIVVDHFVNDKNKNFNLYSKYIYENINEFDEIWMIEFINYDKNNNSIVFENFLHDIDAEEILKFIE